MTISNLPAAVMWGDFWGKSQFDTAMVGITYLIAADPDVTQPLSFARNCRERRSWLEQRSIFQSGSRCSA